MTSFVQLDQLAGTYFHEDFDVDHGSPEATVKAFLAVLDGDAKVALLREMRAALATMTETELGLLWIDQLGAYYMPTAHGITNRHWFEQVASTVKQSL